MKTRQKSASAQLFNRKTIEKKKRKVNSNEVIFAMNNLIKSGGGSSLLQVKNEDCNVLAKRFKIPRDDVRSIVNKTQPRVKMTRM